MKKILFGILFLIAAQVFAAEKMCAPGTGRGGVPCVEAQKDYVGDLRFPVFMKHKVKFMCSIQPEFGSITALYWNGAAWLSWGGPAETSGEVLPWFDDTVIMSHGSLHGFVTWVAAECERRAEIFSAIPLPDPNDRVARFNYAMKMVLMVDEATGHIVVPPPPLP